MNIEFFYVNVPIEERPPKRRIARKFNLSVLSKKECMSKTFNVRLGSIQQYNPGPIQFVEFPISV